LTAPGTSDRVITLSQSSLSTNYIQVQIAPVSPADYDPTSDTVQFAFTLETYPETSPVTWHTGSWVTFPGPVYWAQCLVGPANSGVVLALGLWQVWVKVTDDPEVPVIQQVYLQVTP
jgi:hypothetical protein